MTSCEASQRDAPPRAHSRLDQHVLAEWLLITTPDPRFTSAADQLVVTARRLE